MSFLRLQRIQSEHGFTLIELLGVAIIIILLSLMALPVYAEITDQGRLAKSSDELRHIEQGLERYKADSGHYPRNLGALVSQGYLKPFTFESPWSSSDNRIYYFYAVDRTVNAQAFILADPGPNAFYCGRDDIVNEENTRTLVGSASMPFPCGRHPFKGDARQWNSTVDPQLTLKPIPLQTPAKMKDFRAICDPRKEKDLAQKVQCVYRADS